MLDRLGNEVDFTEMFMEETLSAKDKKELPDSMYGLVYTDEKGNKVRKFPLNDESHVRQAAIFFDRAKDLTEDQKRELARNIIRRAKELDMDYSGWESLKPYLDKSVKESFMTYEWLMKQDYPDPDSTTGTSDFDGYINDDEYYGEADQALMNQIQKKEDNIPLFQLRTYAKNHLSKRSVAGTIELVFKIGREYTGNNNFEKRCHGYFLNLLREIDSCIKKSGDRISAVKKPKWFFYERKIKQLFNLIDVGYAKDRTLSYISGNRGIISFNEKESIKYTYDPNTDILIHRSRNPNINMLIPSHESRDGIVYPRPRIYCYLEQRANFRLGAQDNGQYGDNVYEIVIPKSITVFRDMEYGKPHDNSKYAKEVFINTNAPLKAKPLTSDNTGNNQINQQQTGSQNMSPPPIKESFEEMFGPVIQEAFDAVTGEEIPIKHAYTMEEMKKRTFSESELKHVKHNDDLVPVKRPDEDEVYFGSPTNYMPEIDLDGPLFVTPYKGLASIYVGRDTVKSKIPRGNYNLQYEEWGRLGEVDKPLSDVHVYVEGYPFLEQTVVEGEGYIHCVKTKDYTDNFYRYTWMNNREYLIANTDNMKVEFTRSIRCKVKYYIKGKPAPKGKQYGPSKSGILQYIHDIADKIHAKYKADQKEPTGNQNCLLCSWCAEASIRGGEYLPRPVYSPRDSALEIEPESMITGIKRVNLKGGYHSLLSHLKSAKEPFARWYCHVQWGDSNGGHEFLIVKIDDNSFGIMDAQQGTVKPLNTDDYHVKDIDWSGSYICRIDDKPFKYMKLDQINDPKKTLPWDPKKDIPYMVKHGMCTKEEAEKELKKTETNLFTSELKKALGQTPIQESASDPMTIIPKDLRDWLKKGDYSSLEKDDAYYYVEGHPVEEFFREPEFCKGYFYPDKEDDPILHCIVFSNDNGNGLVYDWTDECYYYAYHDWIDDDTGFLHRERLSSESWTQIIEPHNLGQKTRSRITRIIPKERVYYRFEYEGEGIYDAYKHHASWLQWREFKQSYAATWLNIVPNYRNGEKSYFTEEGYRMFMEHTYPEMIKVLDESKIEEIRVNLKPEDIRYEDKYQATTKVGVPEPKPIQETALPEGVYLRRATESDLTNIIQWKLDSVNPETRNDPRTIAFIKNDAKENLKDTKMIMYNNDLIGVLESCYIDNGEWWYIGEIYLIPEYRGRGFGRAILQREIDSHDKIKLRVSKNNTHAIDLYKSLGFNIAEEDEYAYIMTLVKDNIQEGAWNDIRNGVNPWSKKRVFHITKQGHLDGQIFKPRVPEYLDKYDPSQDKFEDVDNPRICFSNSIEGALNAIIVNIGRWKTANKLGDWYVYVPEKPLKEYKYRTTRQLVDEKKVYDANVTNEIWIEEPVRLKQYGIIHVDQVSDKHTKKTVPTTTGFVGHRYRYDFKYHWLVKPKVIADLPYDYSPKSVCEDMVNELSGFKYGLGYDGSIHHGSSKDFDEKYRLESSEEFEKNGGGICYDYVEWEAGYLEAYGYTCRKFYISTDTKDMDTHTFILVDDGKGGFIYPEAAFKPMEGVYEVKSPEEAALKVMDHIFDINDNDKKYDEIKYYVWEYKGHPPYGSDMETCHKYFTKGEPFHEGTVKKLKRKE